MSMRRASFEVVQVYELLWMSTCDSVFGAPKICVEPTQKNTFQIWAVTDHKSQICDCDSQMQMSFGNTPLPPKISHEKSYSSCEFAITRKGHPQMIKMTTGYVPRGWYQHLSKSLDSRV
jgi:hypothetical protein